MIMVLFTHYLFNNVVSSSDYIASNVEAINK
jgi:hypothetical protein